MKDRENVKNFLIILINKTKELFLKIIFTIYIELNYSIRKNYTPIIIYQMGKVGSSSVLKFLKAEFGMNVFHTHRMNEDYINEVRNKSKHKYIIEEPGKTLKKHIIDKNRKAKIITLIREPISRNISAYFQNHQVFYSSVNEFKEIEMHRMINHFLDNYPHQTPIIWFDKEIKSVLGIDVFSEKFDKESGIKFYTNNNIELLLLKAELSNEDKEKAIRNFLNNKIRSDISLGYQNKATDKFYYEKYKSFIKTIHLPEEYVLNILEDKKVRHFYNEQEIIASKNRWLKNILK